MLHSDTEISDMQSEAESQEQVSASLLVAWTCGCSKRQLGSPDRCAYAMKIVFMYMLTHRGRRWL